MRTTPEPARRTVVVTDLDGCLLDETTYSYEAAEEALAVLSARSIPLVLCSSKTRSELETLARTLGTGAPFIVENGGAVIVPDAAGLDLPSSYVRDGDARVRVLGAPVSALRVALAELGRRYGIELRGFSDMSAEEVASLTGLPVAAAARAREREYDEPFVIVGGGALPAAAYADAEDRGLRLTRGGRFFHLMGPTDKGRAVRELAAVLDGGRPIHTIVLGDSPNDASMLAEASEAIIVPRPSGVADATLRAAVQWARIAPSPGPAGWNAAVLAALAGSDTDRIPGSGV